jgi:hypothetical protein
MSDICELWHCLLGQTLSTKFIMTENSASGLEICSPIKAKQGFADVLTPLSLQVSKLFLP